MRIREAPIPPDIEAAIPGLLPEVTEYLELEESGFSPRDVRYCSYYTGDDTVGFVVFDYTREVGVGFAFIQYSLARGMEDSGCIACWPRTEGKTLAWSIAEFLQMNPVDND